MYRILAAIAALGCYMIPLIYPIGWGPLFWCWPAAFFATYALLGR